MELGESHESIANPSLVNGPQKISSYDQFPIRARRVKSDDAPRQGWHWLLRGEKPLSQWANMGQAARAFMAMTGTTATKNLHVTVDSGAVTVRIPPSPPFIINNFKDRFLLRRTMAPSFHSISTILFTNSAAGTDRCGMHPELRAGFRCSIGTRPATRAAR